MVSKGIPGHSQDLPGWIKPQAHLAQSVSSNVFHGKAQAQGACSRHVGNDPSHLGLILTLSESEIAQVPDPGSLSKTSPTSTNLGCSHYLSCHPLNLLQYQDIHESHWKEVQMKLLESVYSPNSVLCRFPLEI